MMVWHWTVRQLWGGARPPSSSLNRVECQRLECLHSVKEFAGICLSTLLIASMYMTLLSMCVYRLDNVIEHWHGDPKAGQARLMIDAVPQFKVSWAQHVGLYRMCVACWGCEWLCVRAEAAM
jgi:hypothetical protein